MPTLRFHKLVGQVVVGVYDDNGTLIGEEVVAEVTAYQNKLDSLSEDVRAAVDSLNAKRQEAAASSDTG